jgi:hypothetical protein
MNVELAKKVKALIELYPDRHDQRTWSSSCTTNPAKSCGTTACIAGWVAAAQGLTVLEVTDRGDIAEWAEEQLDIDNDEADKLFYTLDNDKALAYLGELIDEAEASNGK